MFNFISEYNCVVIKKEDGIYVGCNYTSFISKNIYNANKLYRYTIIVITTTLNV